MNCWLLWGRNDLGANHASSLFYFYFFGTWKLSTQGLVHISVAIWGKCSMPRTWCVLLILVMAATWLPLRFSVAACQQRKSMSRSSMCRTRTRPTLWNGSPTTSRHPFAISHQRDWRWPWHLLAIQQLSRTVIEGLTCVRFSVAFLEPD